MLFRTHSICRKLCTKSVVSAAPSRHHQLHTQQMYIEWSVFSKNKWIVSLPQSQYASSRYHLPLSQSCARACLCPFHPCPLRLRFPQDASFFPRSLQQIPIWYCNVLSVVSLPLLPLALSRSHFQLVHIGTLMKAVLFSLRLSSVSVRLLPRLNAP